MVGKASKRVISFILMLTLVFTLFPSTSFTAYAAEGQDEYSTLQSAQEEQGEAVLSDGEIYIEEDGPSGPDTDVITDDESESDAPEGIEPGDDEEYIEDDIEGDEIEDLDDEDLIDEDLDPEAELEESFPDGFDKKKSSKLMGVGDHEDHDQMTFTAWDATDSLPSSQGNYYLTHDVTLSNYWNVPKGTTNLCLNGHGISGTGTKRVIEVDVDEILNLYDCSDTEHKYTIDPATGLATVNDNASSGYKTFTGGYITGGYEQSGAGGVWILASINNPEHTDGSFTMYGGTIIGNKGDYFAGGVSVTGKFTMNGGAIIGNISTASHAIGGALYVEYCGNFTMNGGTIAENTSAGCCSAVHLEDGATFEMTGGSITGNTSKEDGAIFLSATERTESTPAENKKCSIEGNVEIKGNYCGSDERNIVIGQSNSAPITISGPINANSRIGVSTTSTDSTPFVFTSGLGNNLPANTAATDIFIKDSDEFIVTETDGHEAAIGIVPPTPHTHTDGETTIEFTTGITSLPSTSGSYYLKQDITINETWVVPTGTTNLCLNGHSITKTGNSGSVINIPSGATLNLYDCAATPGTITGGKGVGTPKSGGGVYVEQGAIFNMFGGNITENESTLGGGVYVKGTFKLYGGCISVNQAQSGAGVHLADNSSGSNSVFEMSGGSITNNTAEDSCGGLSIWGSAAFTMTGGSITGNTANESAGIFIPDTINISGGVIITDNTTTGGQKSNVTLYKELDSKINITGELSTDASIGVSLLSLESLQNTTGVFTSGLPANTDAEDYFDSDSEDYKVVTEDGEGKLLSIATPHVHDDETSFTKGITSLPHAAGSYYLKQDITINETWVVPTGTTNLCLNGHAIKMTGTGPVINIQPGATLELYDCGTTVHSYTKYNNGLATVDSTVTQGHETFTGGYITGGNVTDGMGAGILVDAEGTFKMHGGTIIGNNAASSYGGGVYTAGTFTMDGGSIIGNVANRGGGVFANSSTVNLSGSPYIYDNKASGAQNNLVLYTSDLNITASLTNDALIGITKLNNSYELENDITFTSTVNETYLNGRDLWDIFPSDWDGHYAKLDNSTRGIITEGNAPHVHDGITFTAWTSTTSLPQSGNYYLTNDVTLTDSAQVKSNDTLKLCLNGHGIKITSNKYIINVGSGRKLFIYDCNPERYPHKYRINSNGLAVVDDTLEDNYETFYGGYLTGGNANSGDQRGGGIFCVGELEMHGGTIIGNKASSGGGGISYEGSRCYLSDVNIIGNITTGSTGKGGGIYMGSGNTATIINTVISNNTSYLGGGVHVERGTFNLQSGEIRDNVATGSGGGASLGSSNSSGARFTMAGGSIKNNVATDQNSMGGGVYVQQGKFTLNNGSIEYNQAKNGGGAYVGMDSGGTTYEFEMNGGTIEHNTAGNTGGGIHLQKGIVSVNGGSITLNSAANYGGGTYVYCSLNSNYATQLGIKGGARITDNVIGTTESTIEENVCLTRDSSKSTIIYILGNLNSDAEIGLTYRNIADNLKYYTATVTSGLSGKLPQGTPLDNIFYSDSPRGFISQNSSGDAVLTYASETNSLPDTAGSYYLTQDLVLTDSWSAPSGGTTNLDLNGHGIKMTGSDSVIKVTGSDTILNITDSNEDSLTNYITLENWRGTSVSTTGTQDLTDIENGNGTVKVVGGYITGGSTSVASTAGGISLNDGATCNLKGSTIIGNVSGGVSVLGGSQLSMTGGTICYNAFSGTNPDDGASGVSVDCSNSSTFSIGGTAEIANNSHLSTASSKTRQVLIKGANNTSGAGFNVTGGSPKIHNSLDKYNAYLLTDTISPKITITGLLKPGTEISLARSGNTAGIFTNGWSTNKGDAEPSDYFSCDESFCGIETEENELTYVINHTHQWNYSVDGATITATCQNTPCYIEDDPTLTISVPDDLVYDPENAKEVTFNDDYNTDAFHDPTITYYVVTGAGEEAVSADEVQDVGTYRAKVNVEGLDDAVVVEFTITPHAMPEFGDDQRVTEVTNPKYKNKPVDIVNPPISPSEVYTILYSLDDGDSWSTTPPKADSAGTYNVIVKYDNPNYVEPDGDVFTIEVEAIPVHEHNNVTFDEEWTDALAEEQNGPGATAANSLPRLAGNYNLIKDVTIDSTWVVPSGITNLCLNGKTIAIADNTYSSVIRVPEWATLNLYDCSTGTKGKITGGNASDPYGADCGGGVVVAGSFNMYGGNITGNKAYHGGGVFVSGSFNLHGGNITENEAEQGGGVYYNNQSGTFTMDGGSISKNKAACSMAYMALGGGVLIDRGEFVLIDGTISENEGDFGAGVYCRNDSDMNASSPFTMNGGTISKNTAAVNNGAVFIGRDGTAVGEFTITGGTISENSAASYAGAFSVSGQHDIKISGGVKITGNTVIGDTSNRRSNVCLYGGGKLTLADELTSGASIGVTAEDGVFTDGWSAVMGTADPNDYFFTDDDGHTITTEGGEAKELAHVHSWTYTVNGSTITAQCVEGCPIETGLSLTMTAPTGDDLVYDGTAKLATLNTDFSTEAFPEATIKYAKYREGSTDPDPIPADKVEEELRKAGDYKATLYFETGGSQTVAMPSFEYKIAKRLRPENLTDGQKPTKNENPVYKGIPVDIVNKPAETIPGYDYVIKYKLRGTEDEWSVNPPKPVEPGTYTVQIEYTSENCEEFDLPDLVVVIHAGPVPTAGQKPTPVKDDQGEDPIYTGEPVEVINGPTEQLPAGYKVVYAVGTDDHTLPALDAYSETKPTFTLPGTYYVWFKLDGGTSGSDSVPECLTVKIRKVPAPEQIDDANKPHAVSSLAYTGEAQNLVTGPVTPLENYTVNYRTKDTDEWSSEIPKGTSAGIYSISVKYMSNDDCHEDFDGDSISVSIAKIAAPELTADQKPTQKDEADMGYTGQPIALLNAPADNPPTGYTLKYAVGTTKPTDDKFVETTIPSRTNTGNYNVWFKAVSGDDNHENTAAEKISVTITKKTAQVTQAPAAVSGLKYNASEQALVSAGSTDDGVLTYAVTTDGTATGDDLQYTASVPTAKNAGTYYVWYKVAGDGNHSDSEPAKIDVAIAKGAAPQTITDDQKPKAKENIVYKGEPTDIIDPPSEPLDGYEVEYKLSTQETWSNTPPTPYKQGEYTVQYKYVSDNYVDITDDSYIIQATLTPTVVPEGDDYRPTIPTSWPAFDGNPFPVCIQPVTKPAAGYVMKYALGDDNVNPPSNDEYSKDIPETTKPGTYYLWYKYAGGVTQSDSVPECKTIIISKSAAPALTDNQKPAAKTGLKYNGSPQVLLRAPLEVPYDYEVEYSLGGSLDWSDELPTGTDAGNYAVTARYVSDNYEDIVLEPINVTISASTPEIEPSQRPTAPTTEPVYTGVPFPICNVPQDAPPAGTILKYALGENNNTPPDPDNFREDVPEVTDAGTYYVWYKFTGDEDTGDTTPVCIAITVKKAPVPAGIPTENQKPKPVVNPVYKVGPIDIIIPPVEFPEEYVVVYSIDNGQTWTPAPPTPTEPGDYVVNVEYRSDNYENFAGDDIEVTITNRPEITDKQKPTANDSVYAGREIALLTAPEEPLDPEHYSIIYAVGKDETTLPPEYKYTDEIPTSDVAGDFYVWYMYVGDEDHGDVDPECIPVAVAKGVYTGTLSDDQKPTEKENLVYKGVYVELVNAPTEELPEDYTIWYSIDNKKSWSDVVPKCTETGSYTVNVRYVSDRYEDIVIDDIIAEIKPTPAISPTQEPTVPQQNPVYTGEPIPVCEGPEGNPPEGYTLVYALGKNDKTAPEDKEFGDTMPQVTNAGTYYVWYKFRGGQNQSDTDPEVLTVVIDKKAAPEGVPSTDQKPTKVENPVYKGGPVTIINAPTQDIPEEYGYEIEYVVDNKEPWTKTLPTVNEPGAFTVSVRYVSDNYVTIVGDDITVTVSAPELTPEQKPTANNGHKYTGEEIVLVNKPEIPLDETNYTYKYAPGTNSETVPEEERFGTDIPKKTNIGTYYTWYKVEGGETYGDTDPKCLITTITEADAPTAELSDEYKPTALGEAIEYTGTASALVKAPAKTTLPDAYAGYVLKYSKDDGNTWTTAIPTGTEPDNYTILYKFENQNKKDIFGTELTAKIAAATPLSDDQIPKKKDDLVYTGQEMDIVTPPDPTKLPAHYTLVYATGYDDKTVPVDTAFAATPPKCTDAGIYYLWYKAVSDREIDADTMPRCIVVEIHRKPATLDPTKLPETQKPHPIENLVCTGEPIELITPPEENPDDYKVVYSTDTGKTWTENPQGEDPGLYEVEVLYVNISGNFEDVPDDPIYVRIAEEIPEITERQKPTPKKVDGKDPIYTGEEIILLKPPVDDIPEGYVLEYAIGDDPDTPPTPDKFTRQIPKGREPKIYYIWYIYIGDDTHGDIGPICIPATIARLPKPETLSDDQKPTAIPKPVYKGAPVDIILPPEEGTEGYVVKYSIDNGQTWEEDPPKPEVPGTYTVKIKYTSDIYEEFEIDPIVVTLAPPPVPTDDQKPTRNKTEDDKDPVYTGSDIILVNDPSEQLEGYKVVYAEGENAETAPTEGYTENKPKKKLPGTYFIWFKLDGGTSLPDSVPECLICVIRKAPAPAPLEDRNMPHGKNNLTYTGAALVLVDGPAETPAGYEVFYKTGTGDWTTSIPTEINAGTYDISVKYVSECYEDITISDPLSVTIAEVPAPSLEEDQKPTAKSGADVIYSGSPIVLLTPPAQDLPDGYTMKYAEGDTEPEDTEYSLAIPSETDAGTYTVWFKALSDNNHENTEAESINVTITKAAASVTTAPVAVEGLKYNGSEQAIISADSAVVVGGTLMYATTTDESSTGEGLTYAEAIPKSKNKGTTYVWYKVVGDANHADTAPAKIAVTIAKGDPLDPAQLPAAQKPTAKTPVIYKGEPTEIIIPPKDRPEEYDVRYSIDNGTTWTSDPPTPSEPGEYTVKVEYISDNYEDFMGEDIPVIITAGPAPTDTQKPTPIQDPEFDGNPFPICNVPAEKPGQGYVMNYALGIDEKTLPAKEAYSEEIPTTTTPGTYYVWYKLTGDETLSDSVPVCLKVEIPRGAAPTLTDAQKPTARGGLSYTGKPVELVRGPIEDLPYDYVIEYKLDGEEEWSEEIPTGTLAGEYAVSTRYNSDYYEIFGLEAILVEIDAAPELADGQKPTPNKDEEGKNPVYSGDPIPTVNKPEAAPPDGTIMKYALGENAEDIPEPEKFSEEIPECVNAGIYYVWYKAEGTGDTPGTIPVCITIEIDRAPAPAGVPTDTQKPTEVKNPVYKGQPVEIITPPTELPENYEIVYSIDGGETWTFTPPKPDKPGEYTVKTEYVSDNYVDIPGVTINVTIAGTAEITDDQKPTGNDQKYAGKEISLLNAPKDDAPEHYKIRYALGKDDEEKPADYKYTDDIPTTDKAGEYHIWYKFIGDETHSDTEPVCITATITKGNAPSPETLSDGQKPKAKEDLVYKGTPVDLVDEPTEDLPDGFVIKYSTDNEFWDDDVPQGTETGTKTVYVRYVSEQYEDIIIDPINVTIKAVPVVNPDQIPTPATGKQGGNPVYTGDPIPTATAPTADPPEGYEVLYAPGTDEKTVPSEDKFTKDIPEETDAGTYFTWYKLVGDDTHSDTEPAVIKTVIDKAPAPTGEPTEAHRPKPVENPVYKGEPVDIITPPSELPEGYVIKYSIDNGENWTDEVPQADEPGTTKVSIKYEKKNYEDIIGGDIIVNVPAAELTDEQKPTPAKKLKYTGSAQDLLVAPDKAVPTGYTVKYAIGDNAERVPAETEFDTEIPRGTNAGTYYAWYEIKGGATQSDFGPVCLTVSIERGDAPTDALSDDQKPKSKGNAIPYTGEPVVLVTAPTKELPATYKDYVPTYSIDDGKTWTTELPTGTDPGTYDILVKYENKNKKDVYGDELSATIVAMNPLTDDQIPTKKKDLVFDGTAKELVDAPDAGKLPEGYTLKYALGDDDQNSPEAGAFEDAIPTGLKAGTYYVWYKAVSEDGKAGTVPRCIVVVIGKATATLTPDKITDSQKPHGIQDQVFKGEPIELVTAPTEKIDGYDVIMYSTDNGETWTDKIPTGDAPGIYVILVKYVSTSGDYDDVIGDPITVKLTQENPEVKDSQKPQPKEGSAATFTGQEIVLLKPPVDDLPEGYTIEYALGNDPDTPPSEDAFSPEIPKGKDAKDYYVWYILKGDDTHGDIGPEVIVVSILPMPAPEMTDAQKPAANKDGGNDPVYTGEPIQLVKAPGTGVPGYELYYAVGEDGQTPPSADKFSKVVPFGENAGEYNVWYKIVRTPVEGENPDNYADSTPELVVARIAPVPAPALADSHKPTATRGEGGIDLSYTGKEIDLVQGPEEELPGGYTMVYALSEDGTTPPEDDAFSDVIPSAADAGNYHVWYKAKAPDSNHADSVPVCIDVTILKAAHEFTDSYMYADVSPKETSEGNVNLTDCLFEEFVPTGGAITTEPKGELFKYMSNLRVDGENFLYDITGDIPAGTNGTVVVTLSSKNYADANVHLTLTTKAKMDSVDMVVTGVQDPVFYTGKAIKMTGLTVYSAGIKLALGKDYSVAYKNNKNAGTATITVTGKGNYRDKVVDTFQILPLNISVGRKEAEAAGDGDQTDWFSADDFFLAYTGRKQKKTPKLLWNGKTTVGSSNYTVTYYKPVYEADGVTVSKNPEDYVNAAVETEFKETYAMLIRIKDNTAKKTYNFEGSRVVAVNIVNDASKVLLSKAKVTLNKKSFVYVTDKDEDGEIKPVVTVSYKGKTYTKDKDYTVTYVDNKGAGTGTVIVEAIDKDFGEEGLNGEKKVKFTIKKKSIGKVTVTGVVDMIFDPSIKGGMTQKLNNVVVKNDAVVLHRDGEIGVDVPDYTVSYKSNTKAGTAYLVIKGANNYSGTKNVKFKIDKFAFDGGKDIKITADKSAQYSKAGAKVPVRVVVDGMVLTEKTDYKLSYTNNKKLSSEVGPAVVKITGKGSYKGSVTEQFLVVPCEVTDDDEILTATVKDLYAKETSKTKLGSYLKVPTVKENASKKNLAKNTDFDKAVTYDICVDSSFDEAKTTRITDDDKKVPFVTYISGLKDLQYSKDGVYIRATVTLVNNYVGTVSTVYHITDNKIANAKYVAIQKTYTSREIELITEEEDPENPELVVYAGKDLATGVKLVYGVDYEIVEGSYKNNIKKGTAQVTIRGLGKYEGTKVIKFKIVRKKL